MNYKLLLLSGVIVIALAMSGCISSVDKTVQNSSEGPTPLFTALRTNNTTVTIMFFSDNGAGDVKGLHVVSPSVSSPDLVDQNTSVPVGKEIRIIDPNLGGKVNLTVTSFVNGTSRIVLNSPI